MTALIITVVAVWLAQRLLATQQAMKFRAQYEGLRRHGDVSVGMSKKFGRRVYVALAADAHGIVTNNLAFRGVTVFAKGRDEPGLNGMTTNDIAAGRTPKVVHPLIAAAAAQAAGFLRDRNSASAEKQRQMQTPVSAQDPHGIS